MKTIADNILIFSTVIAQVLVILGIISFFLKRENFIRRHFEQYGFLLAFIIAVASLVGSLFYSDYLGFEPCKFCWYGRIFMYPQVVLIGFAIWREEWNISFYSIVLSVIGILITFNQYILQTFGTSFIPCGATGLGSCSKIYTMGLGYITIPFMGLVAFVLMTIAVIHFRRGKNASTQ